MNVDTTTEIHKYLTWIEISNLARTSKYYMSMYRTTIKKYRKVGDTIPLNYMETNLADSIIDHFKHHKCCVTHVPFNDQFPVCMFVATEYSKQADVYIAVDGPVVLDLWEMKIRKYLRSIVGKRRLSQRRIIIGDDAYGRYMKNPISRSEDTINKIYVITRPPDEFETNMRCEGKASIIFVNVPAIRLYSVRPRSISVAIEHPKYRNVLLMVNNERMPRLTQMGDLCKNIACVTWTKNHTFFIKNAKLEVVTYPNRLSDIKPSLGEHFAVFKIRWSSLRESMNTLLECDRELSWRYGITVKCYVDWVTHVETESVDIDIGGVKISLFPVKTDHIAVVKRPTLGVNKVVEFIWRDGYYIPFTGMKSGNFYRDMNGTFYRIKNYDGINVVKQSMSNEECISRQSVDGAVIDGIVTQIESQIAICDDKAKRDIREIIKYVGLPTPEPALISKIDKIVQRWYVDVAGVNPPKRNKYTNTYPVRDIPRIVNIIKAVMKNHQTLST